jgi:hypothetical protein
VPLSPSAGIMEWVENTKPLGDVLIGRGSGWAASAHARYRPEDWTQTTARSHMTTVCRLAPKTSKDKTMKVATDTDRFRHYCEVHVAFHRRLWVCRLQGCYGWQDRSFKTVSTLQVTGNFHPVMSRVFLEMSPDPAEWFNSRLKYE